VDIEVALQGASELWQQAVQEYQQPKMAPAVTEKLVAFFGQATGRNQDGLPYIERDLRKRLEFFFLAVA